MASRGILSRIDKPDLTSASEHCPQATTVPVVVSLSRLARIVAPTEQVKVDYYPFDAVTSRYCPEDGTTRADREASINCRALGD
jgi:hypothetical protein